MKCPACATVLPDDAKFCTQCGQRLTTAKPRTTTVRANTPAPASRGAVNHSNMVGQVLDGRYRIVKKLGEGGMSFVYLAHDVAADTRYAIKILSPALSQDTNAMARLRREAALGMRLEHPHICHIVRLGETEEGLVYVVMPYVEGDILADVTH